MDQESRFSRALDKARPFLLIASGGLVLLSFFQPWLIPNQSYFQRWSGLDLALDVARTMPISRDTPAGLPTWLVLIAGIVGIGGGISQLLYSSQLTSRITWLMFIIPFSAFIFLFQWCDFEWISVDDSTDYIQQFTMLIQPTPWFWLTWLGLGLLVADGLLRAAGEIQV